MASHVVFSSILLPFLREKKSQFLSCAAAPFESSTFVFVDWSDAYIEMMFFVLQVGAPPEIASFLDEIRRENDFCNQDAVSTCLGADPELDEFMVPPSPLPPPPSFSSLSPSAI